MADLLCLKSLSTSASSGQLSPHLIKSKCSYYHYMCDGFDDRDWGCGYRTLQSLCSWVVNTRNEDHFPSSLVVPDIQSIQSCLVEVGDKPSSFLGSKEWIGSFEASIVLNQLYGVECRIIHVPSGSKVAEQVGILSQHLDQVGSPIMIGGDIDGASKTLIGISSPEEANIQFLIADPHYHGVSDPSVVLSEGHIHWHSMELFTASSFYNFCLPQVH